VDFADLAAHELHAEDVEGLSADVFGASSVKVAVEVVRTPGSGSSVADAPGARWCDLWLYDDLEWVFPAAMAAVGPLREVEASTPVAYDDMLPGCYDQAARLADMDANHVDAAICFPNTLTRFCGQTFYETPDKDLGLACVKAYNDWMVEEWCDPSIGINIPLCIIPLWDVELAGKEIQRNAARGVRAVCFSELPTRLDLPSIHTGYWDPMFATCAETGTTVCMHVGSSSTDPFSSEDAPKGVGGMVGFNNSMASLGDYLFSGKMAQFPKLKIAYSEGQIGWIPYALERADTVWDKHDAWQKSKARIPEPPSSYYYGRIYGCFTADHHGLHSLAEVGPNNICFEVDYPHTDTTWPNSKAYAEKMLADFDEKVAYDVLRGNAIRMLELDRS